MTGGVEGAEVESVGGLPRCWRRRAAPLLALSALLAAGAFAASAQEGETAEEADRPLRVLVSEFPPLVEVGEGGELSGFDIDLWDAVAEEAGYAFEYELVLFHTIFDRLASGTADAAAAGITITADRERRVDFSHQYLESGLRVLTRAAPKASILAAVKTLFARDRIMWAVYLFVFIIICGHVLWFSERGDDEAISNHYFRGILDAFWCVVATMTTVGFGDIAPRTWWGRFTTFCVMISGIALFGMAIAQLTVGLTSQSDTDLIRSENDLADMRVATVRGSTSASFLEDVRSVAVESDTFKGAIELLEKYHVDAVLFDAPPLLREAHRNADVELAGGLFEKQHYGFAFPQGSPLREEANRALLGLRKSGVYDKLVRKWFGGGG